jgi:NTE family protein
VENKPKIGLALGGGAVFGAAHIGVLKALAEKNIEISHISGTSIGAFVAALYAFGYKWNQIETLALNLRWLDISTITLSQYGLLSNSKLGDYVKEHIGKKDFEDAEIPLSMIATDITCGERVLLNQGDVATAVMASSCIPGVFKPVERNGKLLVDGGITENVPVLDFKDKGLDYIIAVDLNTNLKPTKPANILEVIINSFHYTIMAATKLQTLNTDLLIRPNLSSFNRIDTGQVKSLMKIGYDTAKSEIENCTSLKKLLAI